MQYTEGSGSINLDEVTLQDCLENYEKKGKAALVEDGRLKGFQDENIHKRQGGRSV